MHLPVVKAAAIALQTFAAPAPCSPAVCGMGDVPIIRPVEAAAGIAGGVLGIADEIFDSLTPVLDCREGPGGFPVCLPEGRYRRR